MDVIFYETDTGVEPANDFIKSLLPKMQAKMLHTILLLTERGTNLREPYSKPLDDGIFELRAKSGKNISRVLYFFVVGNRAILTHGFIKKTPKTPSGEIERAKRYRADYFQQQEAKREND